MKTKSKKQLVAAIVAGLTLATAAPAFAAANPFVDVPAKHWAYDAVSKLAAAGIIDGYGDGTFRGDRTTTRYEMAQIVGKAMANQDKANAEQKAMIDKLAQEFGDELKSLGVRMSNLENKVGNITWSGQVREWYEWVDNHDLADNTSLNTRLLLFMSAPLAKDLTFKGRLWAESGWGEYTHKSTGADASMDQAYIQGKHFTFGRQGMMLGQGLVYAFFPNNDGATVSIGDDKLKLTAAAFKNNGWGTGFNDLNIISADVAYKPRKDLSLSLVYAKSKDQTIGYDVTKMHNHWPWPWQEDLGYYQAYKPIPTLNPFDFLHSIVADPVDGDIINTWAFGFNYTGMRNVTLTGEYGQNNSDRAEIMNSGDAAKAWVAQAKYKGADWSKPNSFGFWVGYRNAEPGFFGRNGDYIWETPVGLAGLSDGVGYVMEDVKGFDVGFDYTVFKNGVFTLQYFDLEDEKTGTTDKKSMTAQLRYMF